MAYGIKKPPVNAKPTDPIYLEWLQSVTDFADSKTKLATTTASDGMDTLEFYKRVDCTGGARTVTLPAASTCPGRSLLVCKVDASGNAVTVACAGSDTIQASVSISLAAQWNKALLISNGIDGWERIV